MTEQTDEYIKLFNQKNDFLLSAESEFDWQEIYLADFLKYVFARDKNDTDPFEETLSFEYQAWLKKKSDWTVKLHRWQKEHGKDVPFNEKINYDDLPFFRYNPIAIEFTNRRRKDGSRIQEHTIITKDNQECLDRIEGKDFVIASPITYVGRNRSAKNARYLYAFTVDLDGVGMKQMQDVIYQMQEHELKLAKRKYQRAPVANIIVNSGHGLHLYYLLKTPIPLFENNLEPLNRLKTNLTNVVWNAYSSELKEIQYQGVLQGFRLPGTKTKFGETIRAFYNEDSKLFTLSELNNFLGNGLSDKEVHDIEAGHYNPNGVTLKEAERRWPEWYERVIIQGNKTPLKWHIKRDLYDWWLRRLWDDKENIVQGHRYFCMMALATYAIKCDISEEELKKDAFALVEKMDKLTKDADNHFSEEDVQDALQAYKVGYATFPKNSIEYLTGLKMPEGNRRNGRKQAEHLKRARALRDIDYPDGKWINKDGRKQSTYCNSKEAWKVAAWRFNNPTSKNKSACSRETNLDRKTVLKWWDGGDILNEITNITHFHFLGKATPKAVGKLFKEHLYVGHDMPLFYEYGEDTETITGGNGKGEFKDL